MCHYHYFQHPLISSNLFNFLTMQLENYAFVELECHDISISKQLCIFIIVTFYVQMMNLIYGLNPHLGYMKPSCFLCMLSHFPSFVLSMKNISQSFALLGKIKLKTKQSRLKRFNICIYLSSLKKLKGKSFICMNKLYVWSMLWKRFITKLFQFNNAILCVSLELKLYLILYYWIEKSL